MFRVLGVVAVELVVAELQDELATEESLHLGARQLPVKSLREQQCDVSKLDSSLAKLLDDYFDGGLAKVGALGLEVRARRVVERDCDLG